MNLGKLNLSGVKSWRKKLMRKLLIMRHAKSSWDNPDISDFDRPLNQRGLQAAPFMGNQIYKNGLIPDLIVSSTAKRAKQTAILVRESAGVETKITFEDKIYEASPTTLLYVVAELSDKHESVMLVGHNPGMEGFIRILTGEIHQMPTAALAQISLNIEKWNDISINCGQLELLIRPKDLMKRVNFDSSGSST
jgi:phosphohistidine phosphatase